MSINFNRGRLWIGTEGKLSTVLEDVDKFSTGADKYSTGVDKFCIWYIQTHKHTYKMETAEPL